ncbi:MAG: sterol desaturase family protein [Pseudomonadota bacterium]
MLSLVTSKGAILAIVFVALFAAERRFAFAASAKFAASRLVRNVALWASAAPISPLIALPIAAFISEVQIWSRPETLAPIISIVISIVLLDLWTYFLHRAYHEAPILWRLHRPHHLDETLDVTSAVRFHFAEVALSALTRAIPVWLFAMPLTHVAIFETLLLSAAIFHHSNVSLPPSVDRLIGKLFVTPNFHWVHHHRCASDLQSNFGAVFSFWDRLFGTKSATVRSATMPIGVPGDGDMSVVALLLSPFVRTGMVQASARQGSYLGREAADRSARSAQ